MSASDCVANVVATLRWHPAWREVLAFDEFQQSIVTTSKPPWGPDEVGPDCKAGVWTDADSIRLQAWCHRCPSLMINVGRETVDAALIVASAARPIDPPRDYLDACVFDGHCRMGGNPVEGDSTGDPSWLTTYLGVRDTPYTRWVGRWFLIGAVARIYDPGCKLDNAMVWEGGQGAFKSSAIRVLFSRPWYSDTPIDLASKDRFSSIQGVWGYELAEFDGYSKHEAGIIKAFASSASDKYRPPYMRRDIVVPRRQVFIATINPSYEYLRDETGGRRWWPMRVGKIDLAALERDRDLLWSEAREAYRSGERWYPHTPEEHAICREEQADRLSRDAWEDVVRSWMVGRLINETTVAEILKDCIGSERGKWTPNDQARVGRVLHVLGFERSRRGGGERGYVYRKREEAPK